MKSYLLAIDQGTTGTKVLLMDTQLVLVASDYHPFEQHFPKPGWVEHDLDQIWESVQKGIRMVMSKIDPKNLVAIGITNQRETVGFWDRKTLQPLARAIVWQDRRTSDQCAELKKKGLENQIQKTTGLLLDPYFSGSKIAWMLKNEPLVRSARQRGSLAIGTIDTYLLAKLSGGVTYATETSNASRTLLMDLASTRWNSACLDVFDLESRDLPEVRPSFGIFGVTQGVPGLPEGVPISGMLGDQQSALLGQACILEGQAKCTFGTGAFLLMNTGTTPKSSRHRLLSTVAWTDQSGETTYALEGSAFMAGATVQWLRDGLKIIESSAEIENLARSVSSSEGVYLVPAFTGLGAPHWDAEARAVLCGLTRGTTRAHIARAALEGIAFQNVEILLAMEQDLGRELKSLNVDGGAVGNRLLMQIQADLLGRKLQRPRMTETTSLGAVFAAGIGVGVWKHPSEISKVWQLDQVFEPQFSPTQRQEALLGWQRAVARARS